LFIGYMDTWKTARLSHGNMPQQYNNLYFFICQFFQPSFNRFLNIRMSKFDSFFSENDNTIVLYPLYWHYSMAFSLLKVLQHGTFSMVMA
jgi:hypothetical protein